MKFIKAFAKGALAFSLLASAAAAQSTTSSDAVKALKKELVKSSRFNFQDISFAFDPLEFKTCQISYRFNRLDSWGSDQGLANPMAAYTAQRDQQPITRQAVTGQNVPVPGRIKTENQIANQQALNQATVVTLLDIKDIDPASFAIESKDSGIYLSFKTNAGQNLIRKDAIDRKELAPRNVEYLPAVSMEGALKMKERFIGAITACK